MTTLTERRAPDRVKLAAVVKAVCDKHGATYEVLTHGREVHCEIAFDGVRAVIEFDGNACGSLLDYYCVPWNSDKHLSEMFVASVGQYHRMKRTVFCAGWQALELHLDDMLGLVASGEAFDHTPTCEERTP